MADTYAITGQSPTTDIGPTGTVVQAMQIMFTTKPSNLSGRVVVPLSTYTPAEVDKIVTAAAATMEQVQNL